MKNTITEKISKFYANNKAIVSSAVVYGVLLFVKKQLGITIPGVSFLERDLSQEKPKPDINSYLVLPPAMNSIEESIVALWRTAINTYSNNTKEKCADRIVKLMTNGTPVEDGTVSYAVMALSKIAKSSYSTGLHDKIADYILMVNKGAKIVTSIESQVANAD